MLKIAKVSFAIETLLFSCGSRFGVGVTRQNGGEKKKGKLLYFRGASDDRRGNRWTKRNGEFFAGVSQKG